MSAHASANIHRAKGTVRELKYLYSASNIDAVVCLELYEEGIVFLWYINYKAVCTWSSRAGWQYGEEYSKVYMIFSTSFVSFLFPPL